jgi:hypothetical protein
MRTASGYCSKNGSLQGPVCQLPDSAKSLANGNPQKRLRGKRARAWQRPRGGDFDLRQHYHDEDLPVAGI